MEKKQEKKVQQKPPTPVESEDEKPAAGSSYDEESDLDPKDILEKKINKGKQTYVTKPKKAEAKTMIQQQNAQVVQKKKEKIQSEDDGELKPEEGKRLQKVLGKKKTVRDNKGEEWEVVDRRDTYLIQKAINSSDSGSELSYD